MGPSLAIEHLKVVSIETDIMTSEFVDQSVISLRRSLGTETPTALLNFLECVVDPTVRDLLFAGVELRSFELGDPLWSIANAGTESPSEFTSDPGLWIVCEGRVRLLSLQIQNEREISLEILDPEGLFGYEGLLTLPRSASLRYRAVAASAGLVGVLPGPLLRSCLDLAQGTQSLAESLAQGADRRQRLWFFKTQVDWASGSVSGSTPGAAIPSHQLSQWSADLVARRIDRQSSLSQIGDGCFWLVAGQVESFDPLSPPPRFRRSLGVSPSDTRGLDCGDGSGAVSPAPGGLGPGDRSSADRSPADP